MASGRNEIYDQENAAIYVEAQRLIERGLSTALQLLLGGHSAERLTQDQRDDLLKYAARCAQGSVEAPAKQQAFADCIIALLKVKAVDDGEPITPDSNQTLLHWAASYGYIDIVHALLPLVSEPPFSPAHKLQIDYFDNTRTTPLAAAIKNGHCDIATVLINAGANVFMSIAHSTLFAKKLLVSKDLFGLLNKHYPTGRDSIRFNRDYRHAFLINQRNCARALLKRQGELCRSLRDKLVSKRDSGGLISRGYRRFRGLGNYQNEAREIAVNIENIISGSSIILLEKQSSALAIIAQQLEERRDLVALIQHVADTSDRIAGSLAEDNALVSIANNMAGQDLLVEAAGSTSLKKPPHTVVKFNSTVTILIGTVSENLAELTIGIVKAGCPNTLKLLLEVHTNLQDDKLLLSYLLRIAAQLLESPDDTTTTQYISIIETLLALGADSNGIFVNVDNNQTLLHFAAAHGYISIVAMLIKNKTDQLDGCDISSQTPLLAAIANDHFESALMLVEAGANVFMADDRQQTALIAALEKMVELPAQNVNLDRLVMALCQHHAGWGEFFAEFQFRGLVACFARRIADGFLATDQCIFFSSYVIRNRRLMSFEGALFENFPDLNNARNATRHAFLQCATLKHDETHAHIADWIKAQPEGRRQAINTAANNIAQATLLGRRNNYALADIAQITKQEKSDVPSLSSLCLASLSPEDKVSPILKESIRVKFFTEQEVDKSDQLKKLGLGCKKFLMELKNANDRIIDDVHQRAIRNFNPTSRNIIKFGSYGCLWLSLALCTLFFIRLANINVFGTSASIGLNVGLGSVFFMTACLASAIHIRRRHLPEFIENRRNADFTNIKNNIINGIDTLLTSNVGITPGQRQLLEQLVAQIESTNRARTLLGYFEKLSAVINEVVTVISVPDNSLESADSYNTKLENMCKTMINRYRHSHHEKAGLDNGFKKGAGVASAAHSINSGGVVEFHAEEGVDPYTLPNKGKGEELVDEEYGGQAQETGTSP